MLLHPPHDVPALVLPLSLALPVTAVWLLEFTADTVLLFCTVQSWLTLLEMVLSEPGPVLLIVSAETTPVTPKLAITKVEVHAAVRRIRLVLVIIPSLVTLTLL
jgi:hypothetical protein